MPPTIRCCASRRTAVSAFSEFLTREMALVALTFVILYKFCDAFAGAMTTPFVIDLGFTRNDYAAIVKGVGLAATLIGGFAGGFVARAYPLATSLWIGAFLQMASNLVFTGLAFAGQSYWALTAAIIAENFTGAIGTVIFVAYLSALCQSPLHTATQYALLTALAAVGRTYLSSGAGFVAEATGWAWFFTLSALTALPSLALLWWLQARGHFDRLGAREGDRRRRLKRRPAPDRRRQRAFIEIIELAADRHAMCKPRHGDVRVVQQVGDVVRRGLAVDRGVERQHDLLHLGIVRARDQRIDGQFRRADAVERRQRAAEHVIARVQHRRRAPAPRRRRRPPPR